MKHHIPTIKRAREYHLYATDQKRYLDLYQDKGANLMGSRPNGYALSIKNTIETGLYAAYPSVWIERFQQAIRCYFPQCQSVALCTGLDQLQRLTQKTNIIESFSADSTPTSNDIIRWHPFTHVDEELWLVQLPSPGIASSALFIICSKNQNPQFKETLYDIPAFFLAALTKSIYLLKRWENKVDKSVWKAPLLSGLWERRGDDPYLFPLCSRSEYEQIFIDFLKRGVVISPSYDFPSLAPSVLSPGDHKLFSL